MSSPIPFFSDDNKGENTWNEIDDAQQLIDSWETHSLDQLVNTQAQAPAQPVIQQQSEQYGKNQQSYDQLYGQQQTHSYVRQSVPEYKPQEDIAQVQPPWESNSQAYDQTYGYQQQPTYGQNQPAQYDYAYQPQVGSQQNDWFAQQSADQQSNDWFNSQPQNQPTQPVSLPQQGVPQYSAVSTRNELQQLAQQFSPPQQYTQSPPSQQQSTSAMPVKSPEVKQPVSYPIQGQSGLYQPVQSPVQSVQSQPQSLHSYSVPSQSNQGYMQQPSFQSNDQSQSATQYNSAWDTYQSYQAAPSYQASLQPVPQKLDRSPPQQFEAFAADTRSDKFDTSSHKSYGSQVQQVQYNALPTKIYGSEHESDHNDDDRFTSVSYRTNPADFRPCPTCKKLNELDANFCQKCGGKISQTQPVNTISAIPQRILSPANTYSDKNSRSSAPLHGQTGSGQFPQQEVRSEPASRSQSTLPPAFPQDTLNRKGCPIVSFGFGGQLIVMFPKSSSRFVNVNGAMTSVSKLYPSLIQVHTTRKVLSITLPQTVQQVELFGGPSQRLKKKELLKLLDDLISKSFDSEKSLLYKYLKHICELDGKYDQLQNILLSKVLEVDKLVFPQYKVLSEKSRLSKQDVLDYCRKLLIHGKKVEAAQNMMEAGHYEHALILAAHCSKDIYNKVLLAVANETVDSADPLRTLYKVFAGAVDSVEVSVVSDWQHHFIMLLHNRSPQDTVAITKLGKLLEQSGHIYAAAICYLSTNVTSVLDGAGTKSAAILIGQASATVTKCLDLEAVRLSELLESILMLSSKESSVGFAHLLQYKLRYAQYLSDMGFVGDAAKYCDAMVQFIKTQSKPSPYIDQQLVLGLQQLNERLVGAGISTGSENGGAWLSKMPKGIFDAFDRGLTKLISGQEVDAVAKIPQKSTLANAIPSNRSSVADSITSSSNPMYASTTAVQSQSNHVQQHDAYGYGSYQHTFQQQAKVASPLKTQQPIQAYDPYGYSGYSYGNSQAPAQTANYGKNETQQVLQQSNSEVQGQHCDPLYKMDASYMSAQSIAGYATPSQPVPIPQYQNNNQYAEFGSPKKMSPESQLTQSTSSKNEQPQSQSIGFDGYQQPVQQKQQQQFQSSNDEEDYGFGNRSLSQQKERIQQQPAPETRARSQSVATSTPAIAQANGDASTDGSIVTTLTRALSFLRRKPTPAPVSNEVQSGPKEVNLGEQSKFYFDPVLKKWVNEAAPSTDSAPAVGQPPKDPIARPPTAPPGVVSASQPLVADVPVRKAGTLRKGARSRYVDTLNKDSTTQPNSNAAAFMPQPTAMQSYGGQPKIMNQQ